MKRLYYLLPVATALLFACNNSKEKSNTPENQAKTEINKGEVEGNHQHEEVQNAVQLDSGKKWKANPETIVGIANMQTLVQNGISGKAAPATLYEPLQLEFKTIFEKCTMQGEAHKQLHNYLLPMEKRLEKFKEGNISTEGLKEMQVYLLTFKNYFE